MPHILEKIFLSLDYESYKQCLEVSTTWKTLLTSESYLEIGRSVFHDEISKDEEKLWKATWLIGISYNENEVRRLLSSRMVDVNSSHGLNKSTPLHTAAATGKQAVVQLLLDAGGDPNWEDEFGWTPLHEAARKGHKYVVQLLLNAGGGVLFKRSLSFTDSEVMAVKERY